MKIIYLLCLLILPNILQAKTSKITNGDWQFNLLLSKDYNINIKAKVSGDILSFINGAEQINLKSFIERGDSVIADFSLYHSCIIIKEIKKNKIKGYWRNYSRSGNYRIFFSAKRKVKVKKGNQENLNRLSGKWQTTIQYSKPTSLIGEFKQVNNCLQGTFISETGDYRFLEGNIIKDSMFLSCFDGTHCYLFTGRLHDNDSISGRFYSGNHYQTVWSAVKNENAVLRSPDSLTYRTNNAAIDFSLKSTDNEYVSYDSIASNLKPTIVQIFGTWCPNCVDETNFLNGLHKKYGSQINIVGIGFEMGKTEADKLKHLVDFKSTMNIAYPILLGGGASKKEAGNLFPMLNHIMSFPTLIIIDQKGEIVKVHTGFNGPATGQHYTDFQDSVDKLISTLVASN